MKTVLFIAIAFLSFLRPSADDCVILRNGDEIEGKLLCIIESTASLKVKDFSAAIQIGIGIYF